MKFLALSIAALAFATSPVLAQNQPTNDTTQDQTQNTTQPGTTTHHMRSTSMHSRTTRTVRHHGKRHHARRCGCPSSHYKAKGHHRTKTTKTTTTTSSSSSQI